MSEEEAELARELAEELKKLRVEDVIISVLVQISAIGYQRLGLAEGTTAERDLVQSRLAIDTMNALVPVLEQVVPPELARDFQSSVANLQLAYAKAAAEPSPPGGTGDAEGATPADGDAKT